MTLPGWRTLEETASVENMGGHCQFDKYGRALPVRQILEDTASLADIERMTTLRYVLLMRIFSKLDFIHR